jgi:Flp pilus assembly protein TadB
MERCPQCGFKEGPDWPDKLAYVAFLILFLAFGYPAVHLSKTSEGLKLLAFVLWLSALIWKNSRDRRNKREYERLHPPITERLKDHLSTSPSQ